jgi:RsiW-degrading membrane proteinase PrsW (M82 family)
VPTALGYAPAWAPPAHDNFAVVLDLPRLSTTVLALTIVFAILLYLRREPLPATTRPRLRSIVTGSSGMLCGGASGLVLAEAYREPLAVALCMAILGAIAWGAVWAWLVTAAFRDIMRGGLYGGAAA